MRIKQSATIMSDSESNVTQYSVNKNDEQGTGKNSKIRIYKNYNTYTKKLLAGMNDKYRIRKESNDMFNTIIGLISVKLIREANNVLSYSGRTNMRSKDFMTAVILIFPKDLGIECIEYAKKKVNAFKNYTKDDGSGPISKHEKAGLKLPVSRLRTKIEDNIIKGKQIGEKAPVFLAGILEYIIVKILEPTCAETSQDSVITINNSHIRLGITTNPDLKTLIDQSGLYFCNSQIIDKRLNFKYNPKVRKVKKPDPTDHNPQAKKT